MIITHSVCAIRAIYAPFVISVARHVFTTVMAQYQSENYFAIDPVLKTENFLFRAIYPRTDELFADAESIMEWRMRSQLA